MRQRLVALQVECLEQRSLLSCVLAPDGTLTVEGTNRSDVISVGTQTVDPGTPEDPTDDTATLVITINASEAGKCLLTDVKKLVINAGNGHDTVTIADDVVVSATINGGNGKDSLKGGGGDDVIVGGNGKDYLDGAGGNDLLQGGNGKDTIEGGLGNDSLDGGNGPDVLLDSDGDDTNDAFDGGRGKDLVNGLLEQALGVGQHGRGHGGH